MIAIDCETSGVDVYHGAAPFFVTTCDEAGEQRWWEWDVNPLTRQVEAPGSDLQEIVALIGHEELVGQNVKFDVAALNVLAGGLAEYGWPWSKTHDTLRAGHLLGSNQRHDLTSMVLQYLGVDIAPYEERLKQVCHEARKLVKLDKTGRFANWRIAREGLPEMPSAKGGSHREERGAESERPWKFDCWLPRAIAKQLGYPADHPWWTALRDYSNVDSASTMALWKVMRRELERRGLWTIYLECLKVLPVLNTMERHGVTASQVQLQRLRQEYRNESNRLGRVCVNVAAGHGYELVLPKGASPNNSIRKFCAEVLRLPPVYSNKSRTAAPTLNKEAMEHYEATLPRASQQLTFVRSLKAKRKYDTALSYMESYEKFWLPGDAPGWYILHPNLNPTGTDTLRFSCVNPNAQQISKKEEANLRQIFGPAPGREWWSLDAKNIELRIPAYESGERTMVDLFEQADEPPYYGSYHLLIFSILHPDKFAQHGVKCKDVYESTWYQWTKNGNFAVTYGAVEGSGTADAAYHVPGAQRRIKERLRDLSKLNDRYVALANRNGYVETLPDKTVDPRRGYPLLCTRTEWGKILPTVPLNYHVQGTACWWMMKAMIRCQAQLDEWRRDHGFDGYIVLQVHDELVFDFPKGNNQARIRKIRQLMEEGGRDIGVPTPVSCEYHAESWAKGEAA